MSQQLKSAGLEVDEMGIFAIPMPNVYVMTASKGTTLPPERNRLQFGKILQAP